MTVKEFYDSVGASYDEVISRLLKDERIVKYLNMFSKGTDFEDMENNLLAEKYEDAFRNIHSVKGMCLNLGITKLAAISSDLCEELRNGKPDKDISDMVKAVKEEYMFTLAKIGEIEA